MSKKTIKVPFEIILRNKKTKEEMKVGNISVPVSFTVDKKQLHEIMKRNLELENKQNEE